MTTPAVKRRTRKPLPALLSNNLLYTNLRPHNDAGGYFNMRARFRLSAARRISTMTVRVSSGFTHDIQFVLAPASASTPADSLASALANVRVQNTGIDFATGAHPLTVSFAPVTLTAGVIYGVSAHSNRTGSFDTVRFFFGSPLVAPLPAPFNLVEGWSYAETPTQAWTYSGSADPLAVRLG